VVCAGVGVTTPSGLLAFALAVLAFSVFAALDIAELGGAGELAQPDNANVTAANAISKLNRDIIKILKCCVRSLYS
jgi:hypothetical protein